MNSYLPSDNAVIKIKAVYFVSSSRAEADKSQYNTDLGMIY